MAQGLWSPNSLLKRRLQGVSPFNAQGLPPLDAPLGAPLGWQPEQTAGLQVTAPNPTAGWQPGATPTSVVPPFVTGYAGGIANQAQLPPPVATAPVAPQGGGQIGLEGQQLPTVFGGGTYNAGVSKFLGQLGAAVTASDPRSWQHQLAQTAVSNVDQGQQEARKAAEVQRREAHLSAEEARREKEFQLDYSSKMLDHRIKGMTLPLRLKTAQLNAELKARSLSAQQYSEAMRNVIDPETAGQIHQQLLEGQSNKARYDVGSRGVYDYGQGLGQAPIKVGDVQPTPAESARMEQQQFTRDQANKPKLIPGRPDLMFNPADGSVMRTPVSGKLSQQDLQRAMTGQQTDAQKLSFARSVALQHAKFEGQYGAIQGPNGFEFTFNEPAKGKNAWSGSLRKFENLPGYEGLKDQLEAAIAEGFPGIRGPQGGGTMRQQTQQQQGIDPAIEELLR